jgi:xanthine/uracil permease
MKALRAFLADHLYLWLWPLVGTLLIVTITYGVFLLTGRQSQDDLVALVAIGTNAIGLIIGLIVWALMQYVTTQEYSHEEWLTLNWQHKVIDTVKDLILFTLILWAIFHS